ncbi:MAG: caspase domain-containing protein, partial [Bacteroidota bacterium]
NPNKEASDYKYRDLDFAKKDAEDLASAVEATAKNLFNNDYKIYRLTGNGNTENAPTKANLQKVLNEIAQQANAEDILYIFFAGHGDIKKENQSKDIRFILQNADKKNMATSSFGVDELSNWCHPKNIKAQKRVFVFDACHSGQIINQTVAFNGRGDEEATRIRQLDKLKDKNGMMILAAAADNESAYEDETLNQGVLTYHLLQSMKEWNKDTALVIREWFEDAIDLVKAYSREHGNQQEPNSFGDGRFEIGNIKNNVRDSIKITCPKTRVGTCIFTANTETKKMYPNVQKRINEFFAGRGRGENLIFSKNTDKSISAQGYFETNRGKVKVYYDIKRGEEVLKESIELPLAKYNNEEELVKSITSSISKEIEILVNKQNKCNLRK